MPVSIFATVVFGICTWLGVAIREPLMRDFAQEVEVRTWVFVSVPGFFAMLFALLLYRRATTTITTIEQSMSRALLVGLSTWIAVSLLISALWCPGYRAFRCSSDRRRPGVGRRAGRRLGRRPGAQEARAVAVVRRRLARTRARTEECARC
jgi:hypothetical protein